MGTGTLLHSCSFRRIKFPTHCQTDSPGRIMVGWRPSNDERASRRNHPLQHIDWLPETRHSDDVVSVRLDFSAWDFNDGSFYLI